MDLKGHIAKPFVSELVDVDHLKRHIFAVRVNDLAGPDAAWGIHGQAAATGQDERRRKFKFNADFRPGMVRERIDPPRFDHAKGAKPSEQSAEWVMCFAAVPINWSRLAQTLEQHTQLARVALPKTLLERGLVVLRGP